MTEKMLGTTSWSLQDVDDVAKGCPVALAPASVAGINASRAVVEAAVKEDRPVYGITTGFGSLAETPIPAAERSELQHNIVRSHAAGVGNPLSESEARVAMALRVNSLALGVSGIRLEVLERMVIFLNHGIIPVIPEMGSVGASGDLAPLSHLALPLIGEGTVYYDHAIQPTSRAMQAVGLAPLTLEAKEGLALVNGTQIMAAVGGLALHHAWQLLTAANRVGAASLEALLGKSAAFDTRLHQARPHPGQCAVAEDIRRTIEGSGLADNPAGTRVQDPYSLRCMPQVHGASWDALAHTRAVFECEFNAATDNPLVFADDGSVISGGNFHGQPLALSADYATIAVAELANISDRRIEQMLNHSLSGLPPFLSPKSGTHSGYMVAQQTAAALVNENKVLAYPASVDSIPGNASREDHVSMGMTSVRKLRQVVQNTEHVLGIEMMCAAQALDLQTVGAPSPATAKLREAYRNHVPRLEGDRLLGPDIETSARFLRDMSL